VCIDGAFDFKVDFPPNIQGDKKAIEVAIHDSRKGAAPKKWFPGSTMVSPGKYVETNNEQQHKGWDSPGSFSYSPKVACKQGKKAISYNDWTQNKKEQAKRDRQHKRMVDAAIEEAAQAKAKAMTTPVKGEKAQIDSEPAASGSTTPGPLPEDRATATDAAPGEDAAQGEDGTLAEDSQEKLQVGGEQKAENKDVESGLIGDDTRTKAAAYEKEAAEMGVALSPPKKARAFGNTYTPPLGTLHSDVYVVRAKRVGGIASPVQDTSVDRFHVQHQPKYRNGLFLESYKECCADVPMEPLDSVVFQIKKCIDENVDVKSLHIEYCANELKDLEIRAVAISLKYLEHLTSFRLAGTRIRHFGARFIAEALPQLRNLSSLEISDSCIKDDGCIGLCHALLDCPGLKSLNLANCLIEDTGADALGQFITAHEGIERLVLGCDQDREVTDDSMWGEDPRKYDMRAGDEGYSYAKYVDVLQQAFADIRLVRPVVPKGHQFPFQNLIGPAGAAEIAKGIQKSASLTSCDLLGNPIGTDGVLALCNALQYKPGFHEIGFSCWDESTRTPCLEAEAINAMMEMLIENPDLSLIDMGSVVLLQERNELAKPWSRLTQPKRESEAQVEEAVAKKSAGLDWLKESKRDPRGTPGRNTNQNWTPPSRPSIPTAKDRAREKELLHGPVSTDLFFKRPDIAKEVYPDLKQAEFMQTHYAQVKAEVAQVVCGERYIPQFNQEKVAIAGKISRLDSELAKAKRSFEEEMDKGEEADELQLHHLYEQVQFWERAVPAAVDTFYWQQKKKEARNAELTETGWAPAPFRRHMLEEESHVAFGTTVRWSPKKARTLSQPRHLRDPLGAEESDDESEDEDDGKIDPLLQTALQWEAEDLQKETEERERIRALQRTPSESPSEGGASTDRG